MLVATVVFAYLDWMAAPRSPRNVAASDVSIVDGSSRGAGSGVGAGEAGAEPRVEGSRSPATGSGIAVRLMVLSSLPGCGPSRNGGSVSVVTEVVVRANGSEEACLRRRMIGRPRLLSAGERGRGPCGGASAGRTTVPTGAAVAALVAAGRRAGGPLAGSGDGSKAWDRRRRTMADPGSVAAEADGAIARSVIMRFPVS